MADVIEMRIDLDSEHGPVLEVLLFDADEEDELWECGSTFISLQSLKDALAGLAVTPVPTIKKRTRLKLKEPV